MIKKGFIIFLLMSLFYLPSYAQSIEYKYDNKNQLVEVGYSDSTIVKYSYDKDGNRISQSTTKFTVPPPPPPTSVRKDTIEAFKNSLVVYPNPNNGKFTGLFYVDEMQDVIIEIFDINGKVIYSHNQVFQTGSHHFDISIYLIATGIYYFNVRGKTINLSEKVVVVSD